MKIIDFDALFDEYVQRFLEQNKGKYSEEQLEDLQPKLFERFSKLKIKNIGDKTPVEYYQERKDNLIDILKEHVKRDISVNDFLTDSLKNDVDEDVLIENLNSEFNSEYLRQIIRILDLKNSKKAFNRYIDLLFVNTLAEEVENQIIDILSSNADYVCENIIKLEISETRQSEVSEIVSHVSSVRSDVTEYLRKCFWNNKDKIPEFLSYIVKYGDEKLLDDLYKAVDSEEISYIDYKELVLAIDALGGTYDKKRDFSFDKNYALIKGVKEEV